MLIMYRVLKNLLKRIPFMKKWPGWIMTTLTSIILLSFLSLAVSLIFGILVSTLLTLVVIPVLYYAFGYSKE